MRAEYEKQVDLLVIQLESPYKPGKVESVDEPVFIEYEAGQPVAIEVTGASHDLNHRLQFAAEKTGLEHRALQAVAETALANPDNLVTLDLKVHTGAHLS